MNISGMISKLKQQARDKQAKKAELLKKSTVELKQRRQVAEEQKATYDAYSQEKARLNKVQGELRQRRMEQSTLGRLAKGVKSQLEQQKSKKSKPVNPMFANIGGTSPYALNKPVKKKPVKKKGQRIVVYLNK